MNVSHAGFILAAYAVTAVVVIGMIATLALDHRGLKRALARFPSRRPETGA